MKDNILRRLCRNKVIVTLALVVALSTLMKLPVYAEDTWYFGYTGDIQEWTVPESGSYEIIAAGASGGGARDNSIDPPDVGNYVMTRWPAGTNISNVSSRQKVDLPARVAYTSGGHGALLNGTYRLEAGTKLYIVVGQHGTVMNSDGSGGTATYNGGGKAGGPGAGAGGGATSILLAYGTLDAEDESTRKDVRDNAIMIAGGGGAIWSQPVGHQSALEYEDPLNLRTSLHYFAPGNLNSSYQSIKIEGNFLKYCNLTENGVGLDGTFIEAMFPGVSIGNSGSVRAQISGSDIGAHTLMTDAFTGGGGGGYCGGNDGAILSASGSMGGCSYFGPDKTYPYWQNYVDLPGLNVNGSSSKLAPIGDGYVTINRVDDTIQTLVINLGGYILKNGVNQIVLQGVLGQTIDINGLVYASGYSFLSYDIDTETHDGQLWGSISGSFASGQTAKYTFGWNDDEITLRVKADLQIDTAKKSDGTHGTYVQATIWLRPDDLGKLFIVEYKNGLGNWTPLYDGKFAGDGYLAWGYSYTGGYQQFTAPVTGSYKIQLYGAGGGNWSNGFDSLGANGGSGNVLVTLKKGQTIYLAVGGAGINGLASRAYNGGGKGGAPTEWYGGYGASGGGATSVQLLLAGNGELKSYSWNTLQVIAAVGGGGGGLSNSEFKDYRPQGGNITAGLRGQGTVTNEKHAHGTFLWVEGTCWSRELSGLFGQGADGGQNRKDLTIQDDYHERWFGAEPNPGAGGGWTGGWAYESAGPSLNATAGPGTAYVSTDTSVVTSSGSEGNSQGPQTNGKATILLITAYTDSDHITSNFYDKAAPNIPFNGVIDRNDQGTTVITWDKPDDNGSKYNLRIRKFATVGGSAVDTKYQDLYIETGVAKYEYIIDNNSSTDVNYVKNNYSSSGSFKGEVYTEKLDNVSTNYDGQYVHVAAVDGAGNVGPTATWQIPAVLYIQYDKNADDATPDNMPATPVRFGQTGKVEDLIFTRPHFIFRCWNTKPDGTGDTYTVGEEISYDFIKSTGLSNLTLYAQWEPLYKLTVNPNGGLWEGLSSNQTFEMAKNTSRIIEDAIRTGYNFIGWLFNTLKPDKPTKAVLGPNFSWYNDANPSVSKTKITDIYFVDELPLLLYSDTWDASDAGDNSVTAAISGTLLYLSSNGLPCIYANADLKSAFDSFLSLTNIHNIEMLNTSEAVDMFKMFYDCELLKTIDVSHFDMTSTELVWSMFGECRSLTSLDLHTWDVSSIKTFDGMFVYCTSLTNINMTGWKTESATSMEHMFLCCLSIENLDVGHFITDKVQSMWQMFDGCPKLKTVDVSNWNVLSCEHFVDMFADDSAINNIDVSKWNTSSATNIGGVFSGCTSLTSVDVSNWNTLKVTNFLDIFNGCTSLKLLDLTMWDTSAGVNFDLAFNRCLSLEEVVVGNNVGSKLLSQLPIPSSEYISKACGKWHAASDGSEYTPAEIPGNRIDTYTAKHVEQVDTSGTYMLNFQNNWYKGDFSKGTGRSLIKAIKIVDSLPSNLSIKDSWDATVNGTGEITCAVDSNNTLYIYTRDPSKEIIANADSSGMFRGFSAADLITGLDKINTSLVTNMYQAFMGFGMGLYDGSNHTIVIDGIENWDTSNVVNMSQMFASIGNYKTATNIQMDSISKWDTSKVTDMLKMFSNFGVYAAACSIGDIGDWDISQVTNMSGMFESAAKNAKEFNIGDLSTWNTSNVIDMSLMFYFAGENVDNWYVGDLGTWNVLKVTNMLNMFANSGKKDKSWDVGDLSSWDVLNVTTMQNMFLHSGDASDVWDIGDLSSWNTSKVTDMSYMFAETGVSASRWYVGELKDWDTSHVTTMQSMFDTCENANTSITIMNPGMLNYEHMFKGAATDKDHNAMIEVYAGAGCLSIASQCVSTKSSNSDVILA